MNGMNQRGAEPTKGRDVCDSATLPPALFRVLTATLKDRLETKATKGRDACELALRAQGIDEVLLAKKLKNQLEAKAPRCNAKKKSWEEFDDWGAQLAAVREVVKIFGTYPSPES